MALSEQLLCAERKRLSAMDTAALEQLLLQQFHMAESDRDTDYLHLILELLESREASAATPDTEAALQQFYGDYCNNSLYQGEDTAAISVSHRPRPHILRRALIAAVILALLVATVSAFVLPNWSRTPVIDDSTLEFSYGSGEAPPQSSDIPFRGLSSDVKEYSDAPLVPGYDPNHSLPERIIRQPESYGHTLTAVYKNETETITLHYIFYNSDADREANAEAMDTASAEAYLYGGISHYIYEEDGQCSILWSNGAADCAIYGDFTPEEARDMVDSIYNAFPQLAQVLSEYSDLKLVPTADPLNCVYSYTNIHDTSWERYGRASIIVSYVHQKGKIDFHYSIERPDENRVGCSEYPIDKGSTEEYVAGGITHYISTNMGRITAVWFHGDAECSFFGDLTRDEARAIIDSIYVETNT